MEPKLLAIQNKLNTVEPLPQKIHQFHKSDSDIYKDDLFIVVSPVKYFFVL